VREGKERGGTEGEIEKKDYDQREGKFHPRNSSATKHHAYPLEAPFALFLSLSLCCCGHVHLRGNVDLVTRHPEKKASESRNPAMRIPSAILPPSNDETIQMRHRWYPDR